MRVNAIQCPKCKDIIYSRARHDFRGCTCGEVYVDGGFDYMRVGFKKKSPRHVKKYIKATKDALYSDWNYSKDKFGLIKGKK